MAKSEESCDSDGPIIDDNIIRIQLRKPSQRKWELRTRNLSPGVRFPTIQLFDCEGNLLVETNDENVSIRSCERNESAVRTQSLRETDFKHYINKKPLKKNKSVSGGKIYTRVFRKAAIVTNNPENGRKCYIIKNSGSVVNIPSQYTLNNQLYLQADSLNIAPSHSDVLSEVSSYKSSDNEICEDEKNEPHKEKQYIEPTTTPNKLPANCDKSSNTSQNKTDRFNTYLCEKYRNQIDSGLHKSCSFNDTLSSGFTKSLESKALSRSKSGACMYSPPQNKVPFLSTYLKSLPARTSPAPEWIKAPPRIIPSNLSQILKQESVQSRDSPSEMTCSYKRDDNASDDESINIPTDIAANCEMENRLKMYRRGLSEIEPSRKLSVGNKRRHSVSDVSQVYYTSSSSESVDEADLVLYRLQRRISKNRMREKRRSIGAKYRCDRRRYRESSVQSQSEGCRDASGGAPLRSRQGMGSNISQHSAKGLKGRRARSSGDLCNGDSKSQTESSVCGSVVGDVMGWNRSLPNHLDGNRHLADYSRVNNNYAEFNTYNRCHPKGGRGLRYRVSKSGSDAEPVWKLQDPGFDQGYGSERSPEEDYAAPGPLPAPVSLDEYESQLRAVFPFITEDNTFTVVVEKDGRGLGMSVCGSGGLVKIRRLYPPQPAWRTGRLAQRDLLLAANGVPLAGLSTYEALEVLRTAAPRVELRVCRPPPDALESLTPPEPPTPPVRTPHPPHLPPLDPLNCHPMHARLSQTTSSATTSSSEGRGRREHSPEVTRLDLRLPDLDQPLPVYDVQYGEFDIIMTKVNGSLGFTLRKEDHSALGHYVRALVREPALSDGRIQPGDRIVAVNDTSMSNMSHAEAVAFLRACGSDVRLRLYRDHAATPLSPMSPKEEPTTDSDVPMCRPKPPLRAEAVSMLCDLAARRLTPDGADGSRSPCLSPRKFRRLTKDNNHYELPNDGRFNVTVNSHSTTPVKRNMNPRRVRSVESIILVSTSPPTCRKSKLSLTVPPRGYELNNLDNEQLDAPNIYQEDINRQRYTEPSFPVDSDEPVSMPAELSSDEARFKHTNPAYQSAVLHISSNSDVTDGQKDDNGLKKWKAVALSPDKEKKVKIEQPKPAQPNPKEVDTIQKENVKPNPTNHTTNSEPTIVTVELNRGWNSRLGFSVQSHPDSGQSYISAVYNDSVAARDGRLRQGDVILQVNDENVTSMKTPEVIDLLRILRGSICITVLRPPDHQQ